MVKTANEENTKNVLNIDFINRLCADDNDGMSYDDICEYFCINKRTAQRWVATVTRLFPNYLMVRRAHRSKCFKLDFANNRSFSFDFTQMDVNALDEAINFLEKNGSRELYGLKNNLKRLRNKINATSSTKIKKKTFESNTEVSVRSSSSLANFRGPHFEVDEAIVGKLTEYIFTRSVTQIYYKKDRSVEGRFLMVAPIGFLYGNTQYLVAKYVSDLDIAALGKEANVVHIEESDLNVIRGNCDAESPYHYFKISNIVSCSAYKKDEVRRPYHKRDAQGNVVGVVRPKKPAEPRSIYFSIDPKETIENITYYSFGIFRSRKIHHIKWRFDEVVSERLNNYQFVTPSERQKISKDGNGCLTVEFDSCGVAEMKWFLDKFGDHVEVLEPKNWNDIVQEEVYEQDVLPV